MAEFDWRSIAGAVAPFAPTLGKVLGAGFGPLGGIIGGLAGNVIASTFGTEPTPEAVGKAIAEDPKADEKLEALEAAQGQQILAQANVAIENAKQYTEQFRIAAADTANARQAAITQTPMSAMQITMAAVILFSFMAMLAAAVFKPDAFRETAILSMLLGGLMALVQQIGNFLWGSSMGSAQKTEQLGAALVAASNGKHK